MSREALMERIRKGEEYLERDDLTKQQRQLAEERVAKLINELGALGDEPAAPVIEPRVLIEINKIRSILGMPPRAS